jgi:SWI/SNF-related matrix-associated actin-dependent regulator 1 of chromatin subfamily A
MRYCDAKFNGFGWEFKGATNIEELHEKIKPIMIRRLKEDVLSELPGKTFSFIPLELDNQKEYLAAENDFINYVKNKTEIELRDAFATTIDNSNNMLLFNEDMLENLKEEKANKANPLSQMNALKQLAVKGKLKHAISWIDEFMETGNKLVVFAWHQFVIDELVKAFPKISVKLDGRDSVFQKQKAIDTFQYDPACKLFIGQEKAAGVAITLTAASHAAVTEYPWNPMILKQDYDRLDRIGQKNAVNIYQLLGLNTIEEKIAKILDERMQMSSGILDGKKINSKMLITELIKEYQKY